MQEYLENANAKGLKSIDTDIENELSVYLRLFLLLYADDTILLAESREDLQLLLNTFSEYFLEWKLKINVNKKKALIFSKGRISNTLKFYINNEEIEIVKNYN